MSQYLRDVICIAWPEQRAGSKSSTDWRALREIREAVLSIEPNEGGQQVRYAAAIESLNDLNELRRLRADAATSKLSGVMWMIIILGALMSMCLIYLFRLQDARLHLLLVSLLSGFLGLVFLMILLNDRPFFGDAGIEPDSYTELGWMIKETRTRSEPGERWERQGSARLDGSVSRACKSSNDWRAQYEITAASCSRSSS